GFVAGRKGLRQRLHPGWLALGGVAVYAVYLAPVVLTGHWTWLGYNCVNDTANNLVLTQHVAGHGYGAVTDPPSTATAIVGSALASHYPLGSFALLATLRALVPVPVAAAYQPFIATCAALAACSLGVLARRLGVRGPAAAAIG